MEKGDSNYREDQGNVYDKEQGDEVKESSVEQSGSVFAQYAGMLREGEGLTIEQIIAQIRDMRDDHI